MDPPIILIEENIQENETPAKSTLHIKSPIRKLSAISSETKASEVSVVSLKSLTNKVSALSAALEYYKSAAKEGYAVSMSPQRKKHFGQEPKKAKKVKRRKKSHVWNKIQYMGFSALCIVCACIVWWQYKSDHIVDVTIANETQKSNFSCPFWDITGDGYCDDKANIVECGYDFNDCCRYDNDRTLCINCTCHLTEDKMNQIQDHACNSSIFFYELTFEYDTKAPQPGNHHLGNGICDFMFNQDKYFFDIGDCCLNEDQLQCSSLDGNLGKCPEKTCIQSNNFCIPEELGDGICQNHNNGPYCDWDLGDCCDPTNELELECCGLGCECHERVLNYFG